MSNSFGSNCANIPNNIDKNNDFHFLYFAVEVEYSHNLVVRNMLCYN
jgi:hypothetical protein